MFPNPFPFTLYNVTAETPTPPSPTFNYCYGGDWVQGKVDNYGLNFDGSGDTTANQEYVVVNNYSDVSALTDNFTVQSWIKFDDTRSKPSNGYHFAVSTLKSVAGPAFLNGWALARSGGGASHTNAAGRISFVIGGASTWDEAVSDDDGNTGVNTDGEWHHVVGVRENGTATLYIDGTAQAETITLTPVDGEGMVLGRHYHNTNNYYFDGKIDEVAVWDVPLSSSTITELYNNGSGLRADTIVPPTKSTTDYVDGYVDNWALSFDSSDSPKNYIDINNYSDIHSLPSGTISMWINPNVSGESYPTLVGAGDNAVANTYFEFYIDQADSKVKYVLYNGGTNNTTIRNDTAITANTWNHVVLTSDGTAAKIYLNGVDNTVANVVGKNTGDWFSDASGLDNLTLGIMEYNGSTLFGPFSGSMDEVAFWDVELDSGAVSALYNNGTGSIASNVSSSNLVLYYDFEGGPGTSALVDRSDNNHTGSLTNMDPGGSGSLMLYYDFEIGDSNPVSGNFPTSTTVYDTVTSSYYGGTPHTGTMTNMEVADFGSWEQGRIGKYSLKFIYNTSADTGGTSLNSTYVDIGGTATDFARTDAYSISGWLKPNYGGSEADRCDVFANNVGGQFPQGWYVLAFQKKVYFFFGTSGTAYITRVTNTAVLDTTDWVHFTITYDGTSLNSGIKIYIDGSEAASTGGSAGTFNGTVNYSSARLRIGGMANGYSLFHRFPGNMDELAVWDVELDSGAASALYNGALANSVSSSNLVAYYDMETDGPGNLTLQDLSTNAISGSMINMSSGSCGAG